MQARKLFVNVAKSCCLLGCIAAVVIGASGCRREPSAPTGPGTSTTQGAGSYELYEKYRKCAEEGKPYPSLPGKGKKLGLAHFNATEPFCISLEEGVIRQAELAGFARKDMIIMDNQYKSVLGRKNADIMLAKRPAAFIECQVDENINRVIGRKFAAAGIPIIGVDVAVPGAPFMGVDNWNVAVMGGKEMARLIKEQWGGWDAVDMVVLLQMPHGGERTMKRSEGFAAALKEEFGEKVEKKIVRTDGGPGQSEPTKIAMDAVLATNPNAKKIALTSVDEQTMAGAIASLQGAGRWNADDIIVITLGGDGLGQLQIRKGLSDAGIAFFPEHYGRYIIPAICAMMQGQPAPPEIYVENEVLTKENIDKYYPKKP
jgi:ribose transport system substrate-binding protein